MIKGCFLCKDGGRLPYVFRQKQVEQIQQRIEMCDEIINSENLEANRSFLQDVEVGFATWDIPQLTVEQIRTFLPNLKIIFYAAASVRYFAEPFMKCGVRILSAWKLMAIPVAQFTVSMITLANKGALQSLDIYRESGYQAARKPSVELYLGNYATKVGILGAGAIGSLVIQMLQEYGTNVMVYDPFLSEERAAELGVHTCSLEEIFTQCQTISNHIANNPQTVGMLNYDLFSRMGKWATFLNTGRGAQIVEADLIRALREEPGRCAILDVTDPEPVVPESDFLKMKNVFLFPHIAGIARNDVLMFSNFMIRQLDHYLCGEPFENCEVTLEMLKTMA